MTQTFLKYVGPGKANQFAVYSGAATLAAADGPPMVELATGRA